MQLVFATHNHNKFNEVKKLLPAHIDLRSLSDIGCTEEIPETGDTLEANARIKADYITHHYGLPCFADDTGLLVDALNGAPGVYSARYAGPESNAEANIDKLLLELHHKEDRKARFETVIALNHNNTCVLFKGLVEGRITTVKKGAGGFGYDPVFCPVGYDKTFAELSMAVKNGISHRGRAIAQLITYLGATTSPA